MTMETIRRERPGDEPGIRHVNELAFERTAEADLVDLLREQADPYLSLVAEDAGEIVGHICFTPVTIEGEQAGAGLAPMAVLPGHQSRGIGSRLIRAGLEECRRLGLDLVVVLGHEAYYPRFGFTPAHERGLRCEYDAPLPAFMALELRAGALGARRGLVRYHPAFAAV